MNTTIYYFSGTGNSLMVAKDLSERLENSKIVQISKDNMSILKDTQSSKIGFVFPVYLSGMPIMVKTFIENLQINKNTYVFAIATCGGIVGTSLNQIKKILQKKDVKLSASFTIVMPGNDQLLYSPLSKEKQDNLFEKEKNQVSKIASVVTNNQQALCKVNPLITTFGKALYSTFNPKNVSKNFWTDEKCIGCGICSKVCPANNIVMYGGKPKWEQQCESCLACMQWCPQKSIQYKKSTIKRGRYHNPYITATDFI